MEENNKNNDESINKLFEFLNNNIIEIIEKDDRFDNMFVEISKVLGKDQLIKLVNFISNICISSVFNGIIYNNCTIYESLRNMNLIIKNIEDAYNIENTSIERISKIESDIENIKSSMEILRKHINDISKDITITKIIK